MKAPEQFTINEIHALIVMGRITPDVAPLLETLILVLRAFDARNRAYFPAEVERKRVMVDPAPSKRKEKSLDDSLLNSCVVVEIENEVINDVQGIQRTIDVS